MILINEDTPMPEDFESTVEFIHVENAVGDKYQIEKKTYEAFLRLREDLLENDGIQAELISVYRSVKQQHETVARYMRDYGSEYIKKYVAIPGCSEHHTGLAIDVGIMVDGKLLRKVDDMLAVDHLFAIMQKKIAKYGFILRYPKGKEDITKISYESWHFRYIDSPELAQEITDKGLCFEEYWQKHKYNHMEESNMKLVTNVSSFIYTMKGEDIIPMVAQAGFDAIDWCFSREFGENSPWMQEDWKDYAQRLIDAAKKCNITFRQAHAFYPSATGESERDEEIFGYIVRTIEACGMMGIHDLVIHPFHHLPYNTNREELFDMSVQFYKELLPYAEKYRVILCTENMWQFDKRRKVIIESACARPEEFCAMIDAVNSPWLKGCLDIGHAPLVSQDPAYMIRCLGKDRLVSLHIHDVDLRDDSHTLPFLGKVNWQEVCQALAEIGYEGDFTYEISGWYSSFPSQLWPDVLKLTERTGRYLMAQIEAAKAEK